MSRIDYVPMVLIYIYIWVIQWGDDKNVEFAPLCVENPSQHAGACNGKLCWYTLSITTTLNGPRSRRCLNAH
jgi:hypothetical protein